MTRIAIALLAGLLFGLGLDLGGMTRPAVVLGFLDIAGAWNPQLLFVMAGAVATTAAGYFFVLRRPRPLLEERFRLPSARAVDARLLGGAALFGIGWGLVGYCPGPALASLTAGSPSTLLFVGTMTLGWWLGARLPASSA
ncbi:MAG: YeeE/YedE family protein [Rudaea sp.]|uniref:DUF6691 family protein n=1 Tax=Rudaea sp. TaxID=2136325 RepID=UPI0039E648BB